MSPSHPKMAVSTFSQASEICSKDGSRLWQPRSLKAFENIIELEANIFYSTPQFPWATGQSLTAIGLEIRFENGNAVPYYPDGTRMPENLLDLSWFTVNWDDSDENKKCVAFRGGDLVNVECDGYFDGSDDTLPHLGFICEARLLQTLAEEDPESCHLPFVHNGQRFDSCATNDTSLRFASKD